MVPLILPLGCSSLHPNISPYVHCCFLLILVCIAASSTRCIAPSSDELLFLYIFLLLPCLDTVRISTWPTPSLPHLITPSLHRFYKSYIVCSHGFELSFPWSVVAFVCCVQTKRTRNSTTQEEREDSKDLRFGHRLDYCNL